MAIPLARGLLANVGRFVASIRPYADFVTGGELIGSVTELPKLKRVKSHLDFGGRKLIEDYISVLDIAIAQGTMMHGDLGAAMVYDLAWDRASNRPRVKIEGGDEATNFVIDALSNERNRWLRQNVMMLALALSDPPANKNTSSLGSAFQHAGKEARFKKVWERLEAAKTDDQRIVQMSYALGDLRGLFSLPSDVELISEIRQLKLEGVSVSERVYWLKWGENKFELPSHADFRDKRLRIPAHVERLIELRSLYIDKLVDYQLPELLGRESAERLRRALWVAGN
jgi:hypothetical protein